MSVSLVFGVDVDNTTGGAIEGTPDNNPYVIGNAACVLSVASPSVVAIRRLVLWFADILDAEGVLLGWYDSLRRFFFDGESSSS